MEKFKNEQEVAQEVLKKAKEMLDNFLQKKEEWNKDPNRHLDPATKIKGVHISGNKPEIGQSHAGYENEVGRVGEAKEQHKNVLKEMKEMPKPKLPDDMKLKKSEKLRSFIAKKSQKRLAKCGEVKKEE